MAGTKANEFWKDSLVSRLPGADESTIDHELINTLREFYRTSGSWVVRLGPIQLLPTKNLYNLSLNAQGATVLYVLKVEYDDRPLRMFDVRPSRVNRMNPGKPVGIVGTPTPGTIEIMPVPNGDDLLPIYPTCALTSDDLNCNVPSYVRTHFYETILSGVLGRMMAHIKKPYSSPAHAQVHRQVFRSGMSEARDMARRNFTAAEKSWRFPAWD